MGGALPGEGAESVPQMHEERLALLQQQHWAWVATGPGRAAATIELQVEARGSAAQRSGSDLAKPAGRTEPTRAPTVLSVGRRGASQPRVVFVRSVNQIPSLPPLRTSLATQCTPEKLAAPHVLVDKLPGPGLQSSRTVIFLPHCVLGRFLLPCLRTPRLVSFPDAT